MHADNSIQKPEQLELQEIEVEEQRLQGILLRFTIDQATIFSVSMSKLFLLRLLFKIFKEMLKTIIIEFILDNIF